MSVYGDTQFNIIDTELFVPIVTLPPKDNVKLTKKINNGLKDLCIGINTTLMLTITIL